MFVKRYAATFILFIYSSIAIGATVYVHYCMNKVVNFSLSASETRKCSKCGMNKSGKKSCCKDQHKQVLLTSDYNKPNTFSDSREFSPVAAIPSYSFLTCTIKPVMEVSSARYEPPIYAPGLKLHILYSVYLI